jgi:hypothetical protein
MPASSRVAPHHLRRPRRASRPARAAAAARRPAWLHLPERTLVGGAARTEGGPATTRRRRPGGRPRSSHRVRHRQRAEDPQPSGGVPAGFRHGRAPPLVVAAVMLAREPAVAWPAEPACGQRPVPGPVWCDDGGMRLRVGRERSSPGRGRRPPPLGDAGHRPARRGAGGGLRRGRRRGARRVPAGEAGPGAARPDAARHRRDRGVPQIRAESGVPIVMLTARSDTLDIVLGLESGATTTSSSRSSPRSWSRGCGPGCGSARTRSPRP